MDFNFFEEHLIEQLSKPLPGFEVQKKMAPQSRLNNIFNQIPLATKNSAVLILFYPNGNSIYVPFIEKTKYEGVHSGQISLPGGKYEEFDVNLAQTALREAEEEIGVDSKKIKILGSLTPLHIPVSQFMVFPYIGITSEIPNFVANPSEVAKIIHINIKELINPKKTIEKIKVRETEIEAPFFIFDKTKIWGATAMILSELSHVLSVEK